MPPKGTFKERLENIERTPPAETPPPVREASLSSSRGRAKWIKFSLSATLTKSDASAAATVTAFFDGVDPDPAAAGISVYNFLRSDATYEFEGSSGAFGYAFLAAKEDKYYIIFLECP